MSGDGRTALIGARTDINNGSRSGSAYVYDLTQTLPSEQKLTTSDAANGDHFGTTVALSSDGTTVIVGANREGDGNWTGAAYVFDLTQSPPTETKLVADVPERGNQLGRSVAVSSKGSTVLVGAVDDAYVFELGSAGNEAPTALFSYDPADPEVEEEITLDASGSSDPDGDKTIVSYEWDFGDNTTGTGQTPTHTYTGEGDYKVTLTVTDDADATDTDTQTVSVVVFANPLVVNGEDLTKDAFI